MYRDREIEEREKRGEESGIYRVNWSLGGGKSIEKGGV
jgi:hypothetical protein